MGDTLKERPIIFSGESVRAILEGRKTQTRRVLKPQPPDSATFAGYLAAGPKESGFYWCSGNPRDIDEWEQLETPMFRCPYGVPGDRLWVRETWRAETDWLFDAGEATHADIRYFADGTDEKQNWREIPASARPEATAMLSRCVDGADGRKWHSPIHMPRWASRLTLEIVKVRVERVQDISEQDALAEGMTQELCARVLSRAAGKLVSDEAYYVTDADENDVTDGYLCHDCAEKSAKKHSGRINSGCCPESDGPAFCDNCNRPLFLSLTAYGIESQLFIAESGDNRKNFAASGLDAAIAAMIADGIGDLRNEHRGRLAQIGYATLWDASNRKRGYGWDSNPWAWVLEFKTPCGTQR